MSQDASNAHVWWHIVWPSFATWHYWISLLQCSKGCSWKSATACARNFSWAKNRNVWNLIIVLDSLHFNQHSAVDSTAVAPAKHFDSHWIKSEGGATLGFWRAPPRAPDEVRQMLCYFQIRFVIGRFQLFLIISSPCLCHPMPFWCLATDDLVQIRLGFSHLQSILLTADSFEGYMWTIPCMAGHWATGSRSRGTLTGLYTANVFASHLHVGRTPQGTTRQDSVRLEFRLPNEKLMANTFSSISTAGWRKLVICCKPQK